jgi:uncharacterized protein
MKPTTALLLLTLSASHLIAQERPPIIDLHLHALGADANGPPPTFFCPGMAFPTHDPSRPWHEVFGEALGSPNCENPLVGAETDRELMERTLEVLHRRNVFGVTSGPFVARWQEAGGHRIIPSLGVGFRPGEPSAAEVRERLGSGGFRVFGEVTIQYDGVSPSDPRFEPYLAEAEELDVPVGIHMGTGRPGAPLLPGMGAYRARLHSALELEEALVRHPGLRVYLMHAGWPKLDDLLALLWAYPRVHMDTGGICFALPRAEFHRYLRRIVEAGFRKRVMFGSDQMNWPGAIEHCIEVIESADFLSEEQKRDIFCDNAARFLRLSEEEIARHHGRAAPPGPEFEVTPTAAGEGRRAPQRAGGIPDDGTGEGGVEVETTNRRSPMVMTVLEARVAPERWEALRASYAERARLSEEVPVVESFLVQADDDPDVWRIVTVWRDRESLEAMRASGETPTGVLIFRDAGAEPRLSVFTVFANPRSAAGSRP